MHKSREVNCGYSVRVSKHCISTTSLSSKEPEKTEVSTACVKRFWPGAAADGTERVRSHYCNQEDASALQSPIHTRATCACKARKSDCLLVGFYQDLSCTFCICKLKKKQPKKLVAVRSEILPKVYLMLVRGAKACEQWKQSVRKCAPYH